MSTFSALKSSGTICLDVINQSWTPMYELINIFELFLPQLLSYPNPQSPMNIDAANLMDFSVEEYEKTVKMYVEKYANNKAKKPDVDLGPEKLLKEATFHKVSTDCEDFLQDDLSDNSQLSELSDTSDILFEEEIL